MSVPSPTILSIPVVHLTLRNLQKLPPAASSHLPISTDILHSLISILWKGFFSPYEDLLMVTICLTAFFGFLRGQGGGTGTGKEGREKEQEEKGERQQQPQQQQEEVGDDGWEVFIKNLAVELCPGCGAFGHMLAICPT
ncbi:UNVERIFIED_CONTAM: hypothetical protein FKN15_053824 [Acipenser sinensis]